MQKILPVNLQKNSSIHTKANRTRPYAAWELLIPILAACSLLVSCYVLSGKKYFWNDEFYSYYFLSDPSFAHMWGSFHDKINNTPPLYFLLGWLWDKLFGSSELSLRLFSSLGMGMACFITWITLRRTYSFIGVSLGVLLAFCGSSLLLYQNSEARMYGLYLTVSALGLLLYDTINRTEKPGNKLIIINGLVHAAFIQTHLHGLFFSGAILVAFLATDWYFKRFQPAVYLSIVAGWLTFLLYLPSFLIQADAGNPRSYLFIPNLRDLIDVMALGETAFATLPVTPPSLIKPLVLAGLVLLSAWYFFGRYRKESIKSAGGHPKDIDVAPLLIFAYAFLAVPLAVWLISQAIRPIFMGRYLIPIVLSWSILLVHFIAGVIRLFNIPGSVYPFTTSIFSRSSLSYAIIAVLMAYLFIRPVRYAIAQVPEQVPGRADGIYGYNTLPIVVNLYSGEFHKRLHYSPNRDRYRFILDWPSAVDESSGLFPPQEYKHLEALNRRYPDYFRSQIIQSKEFLKSTKRFLVLTYPDYTKECTLEPIPENVQCPRWFSRVILSDPNYKVTTLGDISTDYKLHLVETR